ncbi:MAG TPA: hypothetical protein VFF06_23610 [Polyangia bacterium]|nr:hypothetical protein [Polyangia bacterium]
MIGARRIGSWLALASLLGVAASCGGECDWQAECAAREGASQADVDVGGARHQMCGVRGTISMTFTGPNLTETDNVSWLHSSSDGGGVDCLCDLQSGTVRNCNLTRY